MKKIIIAGFVIAVIIVAFFVTKSFTGNVIKTDTKEFTLKASRFVYSPDTITVNKGDRVKINIDNTDTTHGIRIPDYNVKGEKWVEFTADKSGEFDFFCNVFCGTGHMEMQGKLIVK